MALTRSKCISSWKKCESCQTILEQNKFDLHSRQDCPPSVRRSEQCFGYIHQKKFFTFLKIFELPDKGGAFFNEVIQMSLSAIQLCEFGIGETVVIVAKTGQCIVKPIWPLEDNILSSVFLTKQSVCELNDFEGPVEIRKMEELPLPAKTIFVEWVQPQSLSENQIAEMVYILSAHYNNKIIAKGQTLVFNFYGLKPKLKVISVSCYIVEDEVESLNDTFANIRLEEEKKEKFYKILINTKWKFKNESEEEDGSDCDKYSLSNLGGIDDTIAELKSIVFKILATDDARGQKTSCGVIIHGVSGTGKTHLAKSMISSTKAPVVYICSWLIFSRYYGEAENRIKSLFEEAIEKAPSIILIDELDTFCPGKTASEQEKRVLAALLSMLDKLNVHKVVVIAVTRQLDSVDTALRRPGRFDYELEVPVPDANARVIILQKLLSSYKHEISDELISHLGRNSSHGFVGSDIALVCTLANTRAATKGKNKNDQVIITENDLTWAFNQVKPSAMREILVEVPNVKWTDIGGQDELKLKLQQVIEWPLKHPDAFLRLGLTPPKGVLLFGPPGCSKTMIAKAVATESKLNFISIKGAELFNKWVGESEKAVREVFRKARIVSPSVVFFDEIDAISGERESDSSGGSNVQERVLSQLLTEMDGIEQLNDVTIIAATNRPDRIDSALLRPGRLDRKLYVPLPDGNTRKAIFSLQFTKTPVDEDVDIEWLVGKSEGHSGAEVVAICHEAAMRALQNDMSAERVHRQDFEYALAIVKRQTPKSLLKIYDRFLEND